MYSRKPERGKDSAVANQRSSHPKVLSRKNVTPQTHPSAIIQRALRDPGSLDPRDVLQLQRTIGNKAVTRLLGQTSQSQPIQNENNNSLPGGLKTDIENRSGLSMDDVKVHYDSGKPAELQAAAYTQGTDIHLGPGQEKHLPHEAWHVVQQKQGLVKPTMQINNGVSINDDEHLEKEADLARSKTIENTEHFRGGATIEHAENQPVQLMKLYHGTTKTAAEKITKGKVDPTEGKGEFGKGFYTVYSLSEAKHIAIYYWKAEKKPDPQVAVVEFDIDDDAWNELLSTGVSYLKEKSERKAIKGDLRYPKNAGPLEYAEGQDKAQSRGESMMVGAIKDRATPYVQAVMGQPGTDILNDDAVTKRRIIWIADANNPRLENEIIQEIHDKESARGRDDFLSTLQHVYKNRDSMTQAERADFILKMEGLVIGDVEKWLKSVVKKPNEDKGGLLFQWYLQSFKPVT
jgi:hypothetical protein